MRIIVELAGVATLHRPVALPPGRDSAASWTFPPKLPARVTPLPGFLDGHNQSEYAALAQEVGSRVGAAVLAGEGGSLPLPLVGRGGLKNMEVNDGG